MYMALTGSRKISTVKTPPQNRKSIDTVVCEFSQDVVLNAIHKELKEMDKFIIFIMTL